MYKATSGAINCHSSGLTWLLSITSRTFHVFFSRTRKKERKNLIFHKWNLFVQSVMVDLLSASLLATTAFRGSLATMIIAVVATVRGFEGSTLLVQLAYLFRVHFPVSELLVMWCCFLAWPVRSLRTPRERRRFPTIQFQSDQGKIKLSYFIIMHTSVNLLMRQ